MDYYINPELYKKYCNQPEVLGGKKHLKLDKTLSLFEEAKTCIPGGINGARKPASHIKGEYPIFIDHAKGSHVWDVDGNEYIDWMGGLGPINIGWAVDEVDQAAKEGIDNGFCFSLTTPLHVTLAKKLQKYFKCADRVVLCKSGTDATTIAVRVARAYTGKEIILTDSYHGWTDWCQYDFDQGVPEAVRALTKKIPYGDTEAYREAVKAGNVAAIVVTPYPADPMEPVVADVEYLKAMRELATENDIPLIFDEVRTAFRFGLGGASEELGITPDVICFAKSFGNGYPIAAICGKASIMETLSKGAAVNGTFVSSTYFPNGMEMMAALKVIEYFEEHDVIGSVDRMSEYYMAEIDRIIAKYDAPMLNSGRRGMPAFMFDVTAMDEEMMIARTLTLYTYMIRSGILMHPFRAQYMMYSHTKEDVDKTLQVFDEALAVVKDMYPW